MGGWLLLFIRPLIGAGGLLRGDVCGTSSHVSGVAGLPAAAVRPNAPVAARAGAAPPSCCIRRPAAGAGAPALLFPACRCLRRAADTVSRRKVAASQRERRARLLPAANCCRAPAAAFVHMTASASASTWLGAAAQSSTCTADWAAGQGGRRALAAWAHFCHEVCIVLQAGTIPAD